MSKKKRFSVVEYGGHYSIRENETGREHIIGDGVGTIFTKTGRAMIPGSEYFRKEMEKAMNYDADDTYNAYFN